MVSGITGLTGMGSYRISSIHGNPYTMNPVSRIEENSGQSGKPLVIASPKPEEELYVKDYGELEAPKSTATGDFAEMLGIQEDMLAASSDTQQKQPASYYNDMIGMMGYRNSLREQLQGTGFVPFE